MASISQTAGVRPAMSVTGRGGLVDRYFYFAMTLLIAAIVVAGFSQTINASLLHPAVPRPMILWFHGAAFSSWVLFLILQSLLVRTRNVKVHKTLGWFGAGLAAVMAPLGIATAIVMGRFDMQVLHQPGVEEFEVVPFFDMIVFPTLVGLAIVWRKKPELHRRLMFIATCCLLDAAIGRFAYFYLHALFFWGLDGVILLGVLRDLLVDRRIHKVYLLTLPVLIVMQVIVNYAWQHASPWWMTMAHSIWG